MKCTINFAGFRKRNLNDRGSTLLTVIICIAFISILGTLMLSVTMTNLQMKILETKSKKNFYSCETILEKVRTAAQENASEAVKYVYENDVLTNYASYLLLPEADRNIMIQKKVIACFFNIVCGADLGSGYEAVITAASTEGYDITAGFFDPYLNEAAGMVQWSKVYCEAAPSYEIRLKDITVNYNDAEGYRTAITTDIVITMPEFSFSKGTEKVFYRMLQPFQHYVLVADGSINSDNITGITDIQGNVYSGTGIHINGQLSGNHQVNINGDTIITRGDIKVSDTASLNIGTSSKPILWAKNLLTDTSDAYNFFGSSLSTGMNINGISVIQDDLSLDGQNSSVIMNGAYIGYTGTHDRFGSSVILNGSGSGLDLSGLEELILAGRAHVSVQDLALNKDVSIMTGESVGLKSNQRAYLLPANFIQNVNHNPVTEDDFTDPLIGIPNVLIDDTSETIKYNSYVAATPYKIAAKQTGTTILRYYFLNFGSGKQADSYFKTYDSLYHNTLTNMNPFRLGNVVMPDPSVISAAGNVMSYQSGTGELHLLSPLMSENYADDASLDAAIAGITLNDSIYDSTVLKDTNVRSLGDMYSKLSHLLSLSSTRAYNENDKTVLSMIKAGGLDYIITNGLSLSSDAFTYNRVNGNSIFNTLDNSEQFLIVNGNVSIEPYDPAAPQVFNGILIATGDINICDNAQINGILISTGENGTGNINVGNNVSLKGRFVTAGNINLGRDCDLVTDAASESLLDSIFNSEGSILSNVFKNAEMTVDYTIEVPASNLVDLTGMISYENWRRIE